MKLNTTKPARYADATLSCHHGYFVIIPSVLKPTLNNIMKKIKSMTALLTPNHSYQQNTLNDLDFCECGKAKRLHNNKK